MLLPELYVMRHGETLWNREGRWQGVLDSDLTEKGHAQAVAMGKTLGSLGVSTSSHCALVSPQGRAVRTAQLAPISLGMVATVMDDLREISIGDWTGLTRGEMEAGWPAHGVEDWFDVYTKAPGGEGFGALWERVGRILERVDRPTVIITHGITSRFLRTRAMGLSLDEITQLPGGQGVIHHIRDGLHHTV